MSCRCFSEQKSGLTEKIELCGVKISPRGFFKLLRHNLYGVKISPRSSVGIVTHVSGQIHSTPNKY